MIRVRLTEDADGAVVLESPYRDWEPVREQFKAAIPWDGRRWDPDCKRWIITAMYVADLLAFLRQVGANILDDRPPPPPHRAIAMPEDLRAAYDTLGIQYTAPLGVAEASFKFYARHTHPDTGGDAATFRRMAEAIEVIRRHLGGS